MPRKKVSKKPNKIIKIAAIAVGIFLIAATGVFAYKLINKNDIAIPLPWGQHVGVGFDPETGEPEVHLGDYGCCTPYCSDMYEIECGREYGRDGTFHAGQRCDWDVDECRQGCCLPQCTETAKIQCEGDYGYDGSAGWFAQACTEMEQCEIGCCTQDGIKFQEMYLPCTSTGGEWQEGQCSLGYYVDLQGSTDNAHGDLHVYTCSDDLNSTWFGTGQVIGTMHITDSRSVDIGPLTYNDDMIFTFDESGFWDGREQYGGNFGATAEVTPSELNYRFFMKSQFDLQMSGPVKSGAPECQEKSNFGGIHL